MSTRYFVMLIRPIGRAAIRPYGDTTIQPGRDRHRRSAGGQRRADGVDVAVVGSAASTDDREAGEDVVELPVAGGKGAGIASVQGLGLVELGVAEGGGVGAHATHPGGPGSVECVEEMGR